MNCHGKHEKSANNKEFSTSFLFEDEFIPSKADIVSEDQFRKFFEGQNSD